MCDWNLEDVLRNCSGVLTEILSGKRQGRFAVDTEGGRTEVRFEQEGVRLLTISLWTAEECSFNVTEDSLTLTETSASPDISPVSMRFPPIATFPSEEISAGKPFSPQKSLSLCEESAIPACENIARYPKPSLGRWTQGTKSAHEEMHFYRELED